MKNVWKKSSFFEKRKANFSILGLGAIKLFCLFLWVGLFCALPFVPTTAQDLPREARWIPTALWWEMQADYTDTKDNRFWVSISLRRQTEEKSDFFYRKSWAAHYQKNISPHWQAGAGLRYDGQSNVNRTAWKAYLRHVSFVRKIRIFKQITPEYIRHDNAFYENFWNLRLLLGAEKTFFRKTAVAGEQAKETSLSSSGTPLLSLHSSFELFRELGNEADLKRFFYESRWRTDLLYYPSGLFSNRLALGLFFNLQNLHYVALAQYDIGGNVIKPDRRLNLHTPVYGFQMYVFFNKNTKQPPAFSPFE
ncbi:hypothetical protein [Hugenholtzia roseola]|uniref:hypothetical protein n=1 Tax=Hugenholtzia roseola TaxID=1002 RepID=UPI00040A5C00|nr:hypothetical protein [Hugenholtzia roseola]